MDRHRKLYSILSFGVEEMKFKKVCKLYFGNLTVRVRVEDFGSELFHRDGGGRTARQTHDEANSCYSQFFERT